MSTVLRADADHDMERMECWRDIVGRTFVPLEARPLHRRAFNGSITTETLGALSVSNVVASSHQILRTPRLIAEADRAYYKLSLQLRGDCALAQDGRRIMLRPGDLTIYDATRPYQMCFEQDFSMLVLMFPRELLRIPVDAMTGVTATPVSGREGLGALVATFLSRLAGELDDISATAACRVSDTVLDLVTTLFVERTRSELPDHETQRRTLLLRIQAYIGQHLADPGLTPERIADAHYMSVRSLHNLFEGQATTVACYIRQRRLENCRRDLRNPYLHDHPVSAVAARWGLVDASHFSKLFKATYGQSPRDYRTSTCVR